MGCVYRSESGSKCAIGHLIPDHLYNPTLEGWTYIRVLEMLNISVDANKLELLRRLQSIHDNGDHLDWENDFRRLATSFDLKFF